MMSNTLNASTVRSTSTIEIDGTSMGSTTERKMRGQLARSSLAASYSSVGIDVSPASRKKATSGVVFQTSARITMFSAVVGSPSQAWYSGMIPIWVSRALSAPYWALKMPFHMAALTMVGMAHGMTTMARNSHRALSFALSSPATMRPKESSSAVDTSVKYSVRPIDDQKEPLVSTCT